MSMTLTTNDKLTELTKRKAKLGKLLFIFSGPLLAWLILIQGSLYIIMNWQKNAPFVFLALPFFFLFTVLIFANILFIYLLIIPQCRRHHIEFGYYSLNLALGPFTASTFALGYHVLTGNIALTVTLDVFAAAYTVWFRITYKEQFLKLKDRVAINTGHCDPDISGSQ